MVPTVVSASAGVGYIGQGAPAPVVQLSLSGPQVQPQKLVLMAGLTREQIESGNGQQFIEAALRENLAAGLDALLTDDQPATSVRPSGLRFNVAATVASASTGIDGMSDDLAALAAAVAGVGGANIAYVCDVQTAVKIRLRSPTFPFPVLPTSALNGIIICVALPALAVCGSNEPIRIEVSDETLVHMETVPLPISEAGSPNTVSAPRAPRRAGRAGVNPRRTLWSIVLGAKSRHC